MMDKTQELLSVRQVSMLCCGALDRHTECAATGKVVVTSGSEWVRTSENESGVSRDLASAYVLCLRTFVVPNLQRDEGGSLGK